jgi:hypothetical protein
MYASSRPAMNYGREPYGFKITICNPNVWVDILYKLRDSDVDLSESENFSMMHIPIDEREAVLEREILPSLREKYAKWTGASVNFKHVFEGTYFREFWLRPFGAVFHTQVKPYTAPLSYHETKAFYVNKRIIWTDPNSSTLDCEALSELIHSSPN